MLPTSLLAADRVKGASDRIDPKHETVDLFAGIQQGQLEAKLIVAKSSKCRVMVKNLTDRPLNVQLPGAFAGVPVLAQFAPNNNNNNNFNNQNNQNNQNNGGQRVGVGNQFGNNQGNQGNQGNQFFNMPGGGNNQGGRQRGNFAPFNIAPEGVAQLKLTSVCLDHGKPDPRPAMPYAIKPLASVTDKPEVDALCGMLGRGQIDQRAAQAAAWHFLNDMSWEDLADLRLKLAMGRMTKPYFTSDELAAAKKVAESAIELAKKQKKDTATGSLSLR
ncbi:MAG: hypothetical protein HQ582_32810 [Planctomycetes bacterium]|nr:hypothetical protein [Planctomycetota bacterium]